MDKENEWEHTKPTTPKLTKTYGLGFWNSEIISICCLIDFQSFLYGHYETLDTSTGSCTMVGDLIGSSRIPEIEKPTSYWYWFRFNWLYSHLLFSHYLYTEDFSTHQLWRWIDPKDFGVKIPPVLCIHCFHALWTTHTSFIWNVVIQIVVQHLFDTSY